MAILGLLLYHHSMVCIEWLLLMSHVLKMVNSCCARNCTVRDVCQGDKESRDKLLPDPCEGTEALSLVTRYQEERL